MCILKVGWTNVIKSMGKYGQVWTSVTIIWVSVSSRNGMCK